MQYDELLKTLDDQVEAEQKELITSARRRADAIVRAATQDIDRKIKVTTENQEKAEAAAKEKKSTVPLQLKVSKLILQAKHDIYWQTIESAKKRLLEVSKLSDYPQILKKLLSEATTEFPSAAKVSVRPQDASQVQKILDELNLKLEIVPNEKILSGVIVSSKDGRLVRSNTLDARLDRALPELSAKIAQVLYG